jgi:hypothetical protein
MHLFDPERPTLGNGNKAILGDGSAVPHVLVMPLAVGFELMVMLRSLGRSHSWHTCHIGTPHDLGDFFAAYREDPEATLLTHFKWSHQFWVKSESDEESPGDPGATIATVDML